MCAHPGWVDRGLLFAEESRLQRRARRRVSQSAAAPDGAGARKRGGVTEEPTSRCCGGSYPRMLAVWCSLGRVVVVGRGTDECRRSTGPSTLHQVSAARPNRHSAERVGGVLIRIRHCTTLAGYLMGARLVMVKDVLELGVRPAYSVV